MREGSKIQKSHIIYSEPHSQSVLKLSWLNPGLFSSPTHAFPLHQAALLTKCPKTYAGSARFGERMLRTPIRTFPRTPRKMILFRDPDGNCSQLLNHLPENPNSNFLHRQEFLREHVVQTSGRVRKTEVLLW